MTVQQRKKKLLKKIKSLGILDMHFDGSDPNASQLEIYESMVGVVEEHQKEYPAEYEAAYIKFVETARENVWKHDKKFHDFYFRMAEIIFWGLKNKGIKPIKCKEICEYIIDIEKLFNLFDDTRNIK